MSALRNLIKLIINEEKQTRKTLNETIDVVMEILLSDSPIYDDDSYQYLKGFINNITKTESGYNIKGIDGKITHHTDDPFQLDPPSVTAVKTSNNLKMWRDHFNFMFNTDPKKDMHGISTSAAFGYQLKDSITKYNQEEIENNVFLSAVFGILYIIWGLGAEKRNNKHLKGDGVIDDNNPWDPKKFSRFETMFEGPEGEADQWKRRYNTKSGKGQEDHFLKKSSK